MINFYTEDIEFELENPQKHSSWLNGVIQEYNCEKGELNYIFCSDDFLLSMNKQYLDHDYFTDVITFDYVEGNIVSGDIYMSLDRIRENAIEYEVKLEQEIRRVMVHGLLHLLGLNDSTEVEKQHMREKENEFLKLF